MSSRSHIAIIGWINIVLGAFGLFGMIVLLIIAAVIGSTSVWTDMQRELQAEGLSPEMVGAVMIGVLALFLVILAAMTLMQIMAGIGLLKLRPWGRILAIIIGILALPSFPLGTALGVYTMVILFDEKAKKLFAREPDEGVKF